MMRPGSGLKEVEEVEQEEEKEEEWLRNKGGSTLFIFYKDLEPLRL